MEMNYKPELSRPFTDGEMENIVSDSIRLLCEIGIACSEKRTVERLSAKSGTEWREGRLLFKAEKLREKMAEIRQSNAGRENPAEPFRLHSSWSCFNYADPLSGKVRRPSLDDASKMTRFMDARGYGYWPIPLIPSDINPRHATLACEYIALKNSRHLGGFMPALSVQEIEFLIEMNKCAGKTYLHVEQISISPLRFNDEGLAMAIPFIGRNDCNVLLTGSIPALGASSPFSIRSSMALVLAERLALIMAVEGLGLPKDLGVGLRIQPFDFESARMVFGGPEEMLLRSCCNQLVEFVSGAPGRWGQLHSMARTPDAQAASERSTSALWQALIGIRNFHCAGQLAQDEVFSPVQVMIDEEIIKLVEHACKGIPDFDSDADILEEIRAGLDSGTYMAEEATVTNFRNFSFWPKIFSRKSVPVWDAIGQPSLAEIAIAEIEKSIESNSFVIGKNQEDRLESVYQEALRAIS